ncbi:MAG: bifunctional folylpolyglutamate synthase/dihydrofolate synthase [Christensenellaceae bacterium]
MTYEQATSALAALETQGSVYGLERVEALLARLNAPRRNQMIFHIAGTNGKGSVAAYLTAVLAAAGKRVGTYTSPAVFDKRECFLIDGVPASDEAIGRAIGETLALRTDTTAFETEFAAALRLFDNEKTDALVIECGCGGREDATNALPYKTVACVTSVSLDHVPLLGNSLKEIAFQKVGIVKNCPLVTGKQPAEVFSVFASALSELSVPLLVAEEYRGDISLSGVRQSTNAGIAALAAKTAGIEEAAIRTGLSSAVLHGRFERLQTEGGVLILDGAHNQEAVEALRDSLIRAFPERKADFIIGMFRDKAIGAVLSVLVPLARSFLVVQAPLPRGLEQDRLAALVQEIVPADVPVTIGGEQEIAKLLRESPLAVACGSFSILKTVRACI